MNPSDTFEPKGGLRRWLSGTPLKTDKFSSGSGRLGRVLICASVVALAGAGCSTYKDKANTMTTAWRSGQPAVAAAAFGAKADKAGRNDAVIWHLEAGAAYRASGDYTNSNRHLDAASTLIDYFQLQAKIKVSQEAVAVMSNQQNLPYEGKSYDNIMLHTYRALNYLALGDVEKARPEIIRAYQCQQEAVDENARRIEKAREEEANNKDQDKVQRAQTDPKVSATLDGITRNLEGFKFYADYVNPFTVYLDGLYFLYAGAGGSDLERALKSLHRVIEVYGENNSVQADLETATNALAGRAPAPCTYVIFETGQAPSLDQVRIDLPIVFMDLSYVGAAFPKLVFHDTYARELVIRGGELQATTQPLCSMDSIVALDFKNEFPVIVTRTIISTVAKAAATYGVNQAARHQGDVAGILSKLATTVYGIAVNIADTRSWTTLPKEFQVARVPTPPDRKLTLSAAGSAPVEVNVLDGVVNVIYAKSVTTTSPLLVRQFKLK